MKLRIKQSNNVFGEVSISGSKNSCLPILVTSILTNEKIHLQNVPNIKDVEYMLELLKSIGIKVTRCESTHEVSLKRNKLKSKIKSPYLNQIRASYYLMGALFSVKRNILTKNPGGCNFETRPINFHLDALKQMGARIEIQNDNITIKRRRKVPCNIKLKNKSLGATINIILASVKTKGFTIIENPSLEPEVLDLITILNKMNACIKIIDNKVIINGVKHLNGTSHKIIPDRIEAGSYICLAASVQKSNILIKNANINHLESVIKTFKDIGLNIFSEGSNLRVIKNKQLHNTKIIANNYPSFPTDLQQPMVSVLLNSNSISYLRDLIYPNRFSEIFELLTMNATLYLRNNGLLIFPSSLVGSEVYARDLRAGFSLIIAGVGAEGETIINNAEVILRGYECIEEKLKGINVVSSIL